VSQKPARGHARGDRERRLAGRDVDEEDPADPLLRLGEGVVEDRDAPVAVLQPRGVGGTSTSFVDRAADREFILLRMPELLNACRASGTVRRRRRARCASRSGEAS
jgi:hypothetical protein